MRKLGCGTAVALALAALGCKGQGSGQVSLDLGHPKGTGTPAVQVGSAVITTDEIARQLQEMPPPVRAQYISADGKHKLAEGLARFELYVQEAEKRGVQNSPEVRQAVRNLLVQRLMTTAQTTSPPTDAELQKAYDERKAEFNVPERARFEQLFFAADKKDSNRAKVKAQAVATHAQAAALKLDDFGGFDALAPAPGPNAPRLPADTGDLAYERLRAVLGTEVANAGQELKTPGELSAVIESDRGFYILKLRSRTPAGPEAFEKVRDSLKVRLTQANRQASLAALRDSLEKPGALRVDDKALAGVNVDAKTAAKPREGPPPGFLPPPAVPPAAPSK